MQVAVPADSKVSLQPWYKPTVFLTSLIAVPTSFSGSGSGSAVEQGMVLSLSLHKMCRASFLCNFSAQLGPSQAQYTDANGGIV